MSSADETSTIAEAAKVYPGYGKYRSRATDRTIRVFVLSPAST